MTYHLGPIDPDRRAELFADSRAEEPRQHPRRMLATALALLVMGLFGGGLWFAYVQGARHADGDAASIGVPLIRAPPPNPPPQTASPPATAAAPAASSAPVNPPAGAPAATTRAQQSAAASPAKTPQQQPAQSKPATAGGIRLQFGSVRSEDAARQEWDRIKRKNADLVGTLTATPIRADLGDKGIYYRIQTGPVTDPAAAERICSELKQRSIGCIIVR